MSSSTRLRVAAACLLVLPLLYVGPAEADYPPGGMKPDGVGAYMNPDDGMCVVGIKLDGTMLVDWSITNARDCVAYTTGLTGMTTQAQCVTAGGAGNDGYRHTWATSNVCINAGSPTTAISLVDLDRTTAMCRSKGGTTLVAATCTAYGWVYRNRKADNTLPISGTGVATTDGVQAADGLGFCYTPMRMTSATFTSAATCPSKHNSATITPAEWPACASSTAGCQTEASYDAGLGWSWDSTNSRCLYSFGITGIINAAATKADGTTYAAGSTQDLTAYTNQGDCLANGFLWDNWLPSAGTSLKDNNSGGEYAGMPAGAVIRKPDAINTDDFYSGTGFNCLRCHADQSRAYQERQKPGFVLSRHMKAGDAIGKPFQPNFTPATSDWGLQGVQCAMCHSTARPAQDDLIQVVPAGVVGPPAAGAPKSATGHNQTEYGTHLTDICFHCHGNFPSANDGYIVPVTSGDLSLTPKGLAPIGNQFLNSPHAKYVGTSGKVDIGNKTKYTSTFEGYVCRLAASTVAAPAGVTWDATTCPAAGHKWGTPAGATSNGCYWTQASCVAAGNTWNTTYDTNQYLYGTFSTPNGVCSGVGLGSIVTTVYQSGAAKKIHNLDSTTNADCTNFGDGTPTSGASSFWMKDGELSPGGTPADTAQGNCMTCHDVHWALADTNPEAEPFRRECTTCHSHAAGDASASGAPQIDLSTIKHLGGAGTPLQDVATDPSSACVICHMPKSGITTGSPMHLWRIRAKSAYSTMGTSSANTAADGTYTNAAWVDIDRACGQCHISGSAPPYTKDQLAAVAQGMHAAASVTYPVTFTAAVTNLTVNVTASVSCNGCTTVFDYTWAWGDLTANGTGNPATHTYATAGAKSITLTVSLAGKTVGTVTRSVTTTQPYTPPTAAATCTWNANSWTMQVVDTTNTVGLAPPIQVVEDWGDGSTKTITIPGATSTHTYGRTGTFTVTERVNDARLQTSSYVCPTLATPAYFTISGHVYRSNGTTAVSGAVVQIRLGATLVKTLYTDATGAFTSGAILKPGAYTITVVKTGYVFASYPLAIGPSALAVAINATSP